MIHGTTAPIFKIAMPDGSIAETYNQIPRPPRDGYDVNFEFIDDPMDNPLTGHRLPRVFGIRHKFRFTWTGITSTGATGDLDSGGTFRYYDSTLADSLLELVNVRYPQAIIVLPHGDSPAAYKCDVSDFGLEYAKGKNTIDIITIEFTQRDFGRAFNPDTYISAAEGMIVI